MKGVDGGHCWNRLIFTGVVWICVVWIRVLRIRVARFPVTHIHGKHPTGADVASGTLIDACARQLGGIRIYRGFTRGFTRRFTTVCLPGLSIQRMHIALLGPHTLI